MLRGLAVFSNLKMSLSGVDLIGWGGGGDLSFDF